MGDRVSIWSVASRQRRIYLYTFGTLTLATLGYVVWFSVGSVAPHFKIVSEGYRTLGPATLFNAGISLVISEILETLIVIKDWFKKKIDKLDQERWEEMLEQLRLAGVLTESQIQELKGRRNDFMHGVYDIHRTFPK